MPNSNSPSPSKGGSQTETNFAPRLAAELVAEGREPVMWVWEPFLPEGGLVVLAAFMKVGKSTLAYPLNVAVAQGRPFLGYPTKQGGVLLLAVEEHPRDVKNRLLKFGMEAGDPLYVHRGPLDPSEATFRAISEFVVANGVRLVTLDTLTRFWNIENENDNAQVRAHIVPWLRLGRDTGAAVLLIHHEGKKGNESTDGRGIRGGSVLLGLVDLAVMLSKAPGGAKGRRVIRTVGRYEDTPPELTIVLEGNEYQCLGTPEQLTLEANKVKVWAVLTEEHKDPAAIAQAAQLSERSTKEALEALGSQVSRTGRGVKGDPHKYARSAQDSNHSDSPPMGEAQNPNGERDNA